ncbi:MAG TPA: BT4734/BF3469 family protein, partial [Ruminiclostridium sp.]
MSAPAVSIFKNVMDKSPVETTIEEIVNRIRSEEWKSVIESFRKLKAEGKTKEADLLKRRLPAFATSGVFEGGHAKVQLKTYNGMLFQDFDHVNPD